MRKLLLLFKAVPDDLTLQRRWSQEFVPLAEAMPGVRRMVVNQNLSGPTGSPDYMLIHELYFDSQAALTAAMQSEAGVRAGQKLIEIARDSVIILFADHQEDEHRAWFG